MIGITYRIGGVVVNFPILKQLDIDGYGLYPGTSEKSGLHIDFSKQGLTLILGANGLGKSTLINILFRMLSGPFDLAKFDQNDELGNLNIIAAERKDLKSFFSDRVADNATDAKCTLTVDFDNTTLSVTRNLSNLSIIDIKIGQTLLPLSGRVNDEKLFQDQIQDLSNVSSFGDWLLILHYIVFYQENRRALVWDASAQREILRILLLDNEKSIQWKELTRKALELDSDFRNLRNTVNKQIKKIREDFQTPEDKTGHRNQIGVLKNIRAEAIEYVNKLRDDLEVLNKERSTIRSLQLRSKQEIDSIERDIENNKVKILDSTLPKADDTLLFILATINSQKDIFGSNGIADRRIKRLQLLIQKYLSSIFEPQSHMVDKKDTHEKIKSLEESLFLLRKNHEIQLTKQKALESEILELNYHIEHNKNEIEEINLKLIPMEVSLAKTGDPSNIIDLKVSTLESMVKDKSIELKLSQDEFREFIKTVESNFLSKTEIIKDGFSDIVQNFLVEECEITWFEVPWKLGQTGDPINFPAFIFKMRSGGHQLITERSSPTQVSESQREFIDLAFRIALIKTTGCNGIGSIIMDTPEASLDAIFVKNAANIFINFANQHGNKLVLTSNLIDGELLPRLVANLHDNEAQNSGIINLLEIATPSKAVNDYRDDYTSKYNNIIESSTRFITRNEGL